MRTRINNITFTPGTRSINTGITDLTVDDVRLFINESQMKVICSSMLKSNIDSIVSGVVTYKNIFPVLASGDHITFEIDLGDNAAKQGSNPSVSLTSIDEKIDDFYDTFDADMALQLQGIIGEGEESVEGNSQTEGEIERLRTLQESYDALASNSSAIGLAADVAQGKAAIVDAIEDKGGTASTAMSLTGLAQAIDSIQVPTQLRLNDVAFENSVNNPIIDMSGIKVLYKNAVNFQNYGSIEEVRNFPQMPNLNNIQNLFSGCSSLKRVDLSGLDTSLCTNLSCLFNSCGSIENVDISMLDSSSCTSSAMLFSGCSSLKTVNMRNFHFAGYVYFILYNTPLVESADMRDTDASRITSFSTCFSTMSNLSTLIGGETYQNVVDNNICIMRGLNVSWQSTLANIQNLDQASLRALINGLADRTGQSALTLSQLGAGNLAKLSAEDIAVATAKNWNITA